MLPNQTIVVLACPPCHNWALHILILSAQSGIVKSGVITAACISAWVGTIQKLWVGTMPLSPAMMNLFFKRTIIRPSWPPKRDWSGPSVSLGRTISVLPCLYHRDENKKLWFLVPCSGTRRIWWCYILTCMREHSYFCSKKRRSDFCSFFYLLRTV